VSDLKSGHFPPPEHSLNYSKNYVYDHDLSDAFSGVSYFPKGMDRMDLYIPAQRGFERDIIKRLDYWNKLRKEKSD
jgi:putative ATPase